VAHREIQVEINALVRSDDEARLALARKRLRARGLSALPQIETSMHAAPERGRLALVGTLEALADAEVISILRHLAVYDASAQVRGESERILKSWAGGTTALGEPARAALRRVAELRASGPTP
jgi:hypothetical protein